ncbi:succinoglycan biosynthesis protein exoa [Sphingomonas sp. Root710]|uniref:glycosyltransferase family 2 protein n=1 Tax=Sphingomonas sp. Root710 TaxID=1736594 RepID=UPI0006F5E487|nr:glycosyltransferase family 2 protein [Sphingomonas sp. Root710]KRB86233.1 succinoglycan biosynthesis protein exoa [Sphingomonas sp. Root710]
MTSLAADAREVLIVVPCLNEETNLPRLLYQLLADANGADIVIADGGSTDASREIVYDYQRDHPNLHLLDNPRRIQSAGVNLAVTTMGRDKRWLLRIDAHCDYPPGYMAGLLDSAARRDASSVVVPMVTQGRHCFQRACAFAQNSLIGTGGSPHRHVGEGRYVDHGHHALMRIDLFLAVGGYRESQSHNEDAELDLRLQAAGGRIWLEPSQAIIYHPRRTPLALLRQYFRYGEGRAKTMRLHGTRLKARQAMPLLVPVALLLLLLAPLHPTFALPALGWASICLLYGLMIGVRARSGCAAASGIAAMIMHLGWGSGYLWQQFQPRPADRHLPALVLR